MKALKYIIPLIALLVLIAWLNPVVVIGPGERGVVIRLGAVQDRVLNEGLNFVMPGIESVEVLDVKTQKEQVIAESYSRDLQSVKVEIALNFHVDQLMVNKLLQEVGRDYESRVIAPVIQESVKAVVAEFTASELVSRREEVKHKIRTNLIEVLNPRYIVVDEFTIVNIDFSDDYENAIGEKQVAEQRALTAQNDLKRIQVEAEQRVAQATAEAQAIKIQSDALKESKELVKLEAVKKWNGVLPNYMLGGSTPFIDVSSKDSSKESKSE